MQKKYNIFFEEKKNNITNHVQKQKHFSNKQKVYSKEIYKLKAKEDDTSSFQPLVSRDR